MLARMLVSLRVDMDATTARSAQNLTGRKKEQTGLEDERQH
jgi:hypothetical protein